MKKDVPQKKKPRNLDCPCEGETIMEKLIKKYAQKLVDSGLAEQSGIHQAVAAGIDDALVWNTQADEKQFLEPIFSKLDINSLIFIRPVEPYCSLLKYLGQAALKGNGCIEPKDCETRTFLHDLPVVDTPDPQKTVAILEKRKSVIICPKDASQPPAVIACGTVSPEQAFVTISSVCFACFIKFFTDYLEDCRDKKNTADQDRLFDKISLMIPPLKTHFTMDSKAPFAREEQVYEAIIEAGKKTVDYGLVDSYFGNVSYLWNNTLYISQTGSSLDELSACIDPVPLDGSSSAGLTASSELSAHLRSIEKTGARAILHGHPKFSVIMSMDCDPAEKKSCPNKDQCHILCDKKRCIGPTPIVPGEVGTGPTGLCNTLPLALEHSDSAIVYGHGLFTVSKDDFHHAFSTMLEVENHCRTQYFKLIRQLKET